MFCRYPVCCFQCCYPYCNKSRSLERQSQWPTEGHSYQNQGQQPQQWPSEGHGSQGPGQQQQPQPWPSDGHGTTDDDWPPLEPYDAKKYCKEHCTAMSFNEKVRIADSCQGYTVFMCFYSGFEHFAGNWKINGVGNDNNNSYVFVEDAKGISRTFNIRNIKCLSPCR